MPHLPEKDVQAPPTDGEPTRSQQPSRLYSPTMPHLEMMLPSFNGASSHKNLSNQISPAKSLASRISIDSTNHVTKDLPKPSAPRGDSTTDHPSAPKSPVLTSKPNKTERATAVTNGKTATTNENTALPNGNVTLHNGINITHKGDTNVPDKIVSASSGNFAAPNGYMTASNGDMFAPSGAHIPAPSKQALSSANSSLSLDKPTIPGLLPATNQNAVGSRPPTSTDSVLQVPTQTYQAPMETTSLQGPLQGLFDSLRLNQGYLSSSGATNQMNSPVPAANNAYNNTQHHMASYPEPNQERPATGGAKPQGPSSIHFTNGISPHILQTHAQQELSKEQLREIVNAAAVRIEALTRGIVAEVETVRRYLQ